MAKGLVGRGGGESQKWVWNESKGAGREEWAQMGSADSSYSTDLGPVEVTSETQRHIAPGTLALWFLQESLGAQ